MVVFPSISRTELESGKAAQANFSVTVRCENTAVGGVAQNQTALGLQVPYESFLAAQTLGLVNSSGGVSHLLSENYGQTGMARGVGIQIANASDGIVRQFLGWDRCTTTSCATGNSGGWYPVNVGATRIAGSGNTQDYLINFNASLVRLPDEAIAAGKVDARAYVWVKVQ